MGEPAGIGGELTLKAWLRRGALAAPFFAIDDPARLKAIAARLDLPVPIDVIDDRAPDSVLRARFADALPVLPVRGTVVDSPGVLRAENAQAVIASIEQAVSLAKSGRASAVVTNPIQKAALYRAGFDYPGHTEFLGALDGSGIEPVMMLAAPALRVVPVTVHVSLQQAIASLSSHAIERATRTTASALTRDFGIAQPRIAILGLNPHAGEAGSMGREDIDIVMPAIDRLRAAGLQVIGPLSPDTAFTAEARRSYDVAICMYHDQGLIPLKTLDIHGGVNVTLGLSFVRTSPDHGTALDIAGRGIANPGSLIAALNMAAAMAAQRELHAASVARNIDASTSADPSSAASTATSIATKEPRA